MFCKGSGMNDMRLFDSVKLLLYHSKREGSATLIWSLFPFYINCSILFWSFSVSDGLAIMVGQIE